MKKGCMTGLVLVVVLAAILAFAWPQLSQGVLKVLYPQRYTDLVEQEAAQFDLDPDLVLSLIHILAASAVCLLEQAAG